MFKLWCERGIRPLTRAHIFTYKINYAEVCNWSFGATVLTNREKNIIAVLRFEKTF